MFDASFGRRDIEFQVYPEYGGEEAAREEAERYATIFGRIPWEAMSLVREVELQKSGTSIAVGFYTSWHDPEWANTILVSTDVAMKNAVSRGYMEEVFFHEGGHASIEEDHKTSPGWVAAQEADPTFISTYARDNPVREDIARNPLRMVRGSLSA